MPNTVTETRIARCTTRRPGRRWRWDITTYAPTAPTYPGVYDGRLHQYGDCGYTRTWLGAALAVARRITSRASTDTGGKDQ